MYLLTHQWRFIEQYRRQRECRFLLVTKLDERSPCHSHLLQIVELTLILMLQSHIERGHRSQQTRNVILVHRFFPFVHSFLVCTLYVCAYRLDSNMYSVHSEEKRGAPLIAAANPKASHTHTYIRRTSCKIDDNFAWHIIVARTVNFNNNNRHKPYARYVFYDAASSSRRRDRSKQQRTHTARSTFHSNHFIASCALSPLSTWFNLPSHDTRHTRHTRIALKCQRTARTHRISYTI